MVDIQTLTPFSTAARYADSVQSWLGKYDQQRVAAYQVYEDIYWGQLNLIKAAASNDDPIQVPVARQIVEAVVRYLAVGWDLYVDPAYGTPESRTAADASFRRLFRRENVWSKFAAQRRWGLVKGDAVWHVTADPTKPVGTRLSLHVVDPATWFPILADDTDDRVVGVHLAEPVTVGKDVVIRRQTYRRLVDDAGDVTVTSELAYYETSGWDDRDGGEVKMLQVLHPEVVLDGITQLPVYRVPNTVNPGDPYGSSLLRGLERLFKGVDMTITDEDLAVALAGLGFFATDSKGPVNPDGTEADGYNISPLNVLQLGTNAKGDPAKFERVSGVTSVAPSLEHAGYLETAARKGAAVPAVAVGDVEQAVAESGIALFLRLSPLLAANAEREDVMLGVYSQMLHDLQHEWFPAYEGVEFPDVVVDTLVGDPMPTNREARITEVVTLATSTPPLLTIDEARTELAKLGYQFGAVGSDALLDQMRRQAVNVDPFAGRLADEASGDTADATG